MRVHALTFLTRSNDHQKIALCCRDTHGSFLDDIAANLGAIDRYPRLIQHTRHVGTDNLAMPQHDAASQVCINVASQHVAYGGYAGGLIQKASCRTWAQRIEGMDKQLSMLLRE